MTQLYMDTNIAVVLKLQSIESIPFSSNDNIEGNLSIQNKMVTQNYTDVVPTYYSRYVLTIC